MISLRLLSQSLKLDFSLSVSHLLGPCEYPNEEVPWLTTDAPPWPHSWARTGYLVRSPDSILGWILHSIAQAQSKEEAL